MDEDKRGTDRLLLIEVVLILALIGLGIVLYWRPAAEGMRSANWWSWMVLGALFFGIAWIHTRRRKRRAHRELHRVLDAEGEDAWPRTGPDR